MRCGWRRRSKRSSPSGLKTRHARSALLLDEDAHAGGAADGIDHRQRRIAGTIRLPLRDPPAGELRQRLAIGKPAERRASALELECQRRKRLMVRTELDACALGRKHDL